MTAGTADWMPVPANWSAAPCPSFQVFWQLQPAVPVTLGGKLDPALRKHYGGRYRPSAACSQEQMVYCGVFPHVGDGHALLGRGALMGVDWDAPIMEPDKANCSIESPANLAGGELLFQDRLYITTKVRQQGPTGAQRGAKGAHRMLPLLTCCCPPALCPARAAKVLHADLGVLRQYRRPQRRRAPQRGRALCRDRVCWAADRRHRQGPRRACPRGGGGGAVEQQPCQCSPSAAVERAAAAAHSQHTACCRRAPGHLPGRASVRPDGARARCLRPLGPRSEQALPDARVHVAVGESSAILRTPPFHPY